MIIEKVKQYDPRFGWSILIKEFSKKDFKKLNILLEKLGMEKSKYDEKMGKELSKKGFNIGLKKKYNSRVKREFMKIREIILKPIRRIKYGRIISRTFTNKNSFFYYTYVARREFFSSTWESKELDGEEFMSIVLSNLNYEHTH